MLTMSIKLTQEGIKTIQSFINECKLKRKKILKENNITEDYTTIPNLYDILSDIEVFVDNDGDYYNCWEITDNVNSELLRLKRGIDFV